MIDHSRLRLELGGLLVAIGARNCNVSAGENEFRLLVLGQAESGGLVCLDSVASVTGVEVWSPGELCRVFVGVTVGAALELHFEQSVLPFRDMALSTFQPRVSTLQRVGTQGVLLHGEQGRLPALHRVAGGALSTIGAFRELAAMRIGLVAIHALLESDWLFEVPIGMALGAIDEDVLALKRVPSLRVVETLVDRLQQNLFPSAGAVTRLAALGEASAVRIFVAIGALIERDAHILRLAVRSVGVALRALHFLVQSGQRITRLRVIKLTLARADADRLPVHKL